MKDLEINKYRNLVETKFTENLTKLFFGIFIVNCLLPAYML